MFASLSGDNRSFDDAGGGRKSYDDVNANGTIEAWINSTSIIPILHRGLDRTG